MKKLFFPVLMMVGALLFLQNCTSDREVDPRSENKNSMKIAHENNPEASCEELGGLEGDEVIGYLNSLATEDMTTEPCSTPFGGEYNVLGSGSISDFYCGEEYSYYGCYDPETLEQIWQDAYNFGIGSLNSVPCLPENKYVQRLWIEFEWYDDPFPNNDCATAYSLKYTIYWRCCSDPGETLPPSDG